MHTIQGRSCIVSIEVDIVKAIEFSSQSCVSTVIDHPKSYIVALLRNYDPQRVGPEIIFAPLPWSSWFENRPLGVWLLSNVYMVAATTLGCEIAATFIYFL